MRCWRAAILAIIGGPLVIPERPCDAAQAGPEAAAREASPPVPPPRPAETAPTAEGATATPLPPPRPDTPAPAPVPVGSEAAGETAACHERLQRLGVRFEPRPPLQEGSCGTPDPLLLEGLPDGVAVPPGVTVACPVAEALARWTLDALGPEAQRSFGEDLTRVVIGTSYQCRDQRSGGKPSEHAYANAVDVAGFTIGRDRVVAVAAHPAGSPEAAFQAAVRRAACTYFSTVLGPGEAGHDDHLHLDLRERKGGYRICQ